MLFEKRYYYYLVRFETEKAYWYRSVSGFYRLGAKVIVPIFNNGLWKIGTVCGKQQFTAKNVPIPLDRTKGIVEAAGWLSESKVRAHNNRIQTSRYPPLDISLACVKTGRGDVSYVTCQRERDILKQRLPRKYKNIVLIENYPVADLSEIPYEAQRRLKEEEDKMLDAWMWEMMLMEDD